MLRSGDHEAAQQLFASFARNVEDLIEGIVSLCYYMRGSVTYEEMMGRTSGERKVIQQFVKKRLDSQKDSMHPVY